jgi:hypothetical protein
MENGERDLPTRGAGSTSQGRRNSTGEKGRSSPPARMDGCSLPVSGGSSLVGGEQTSRRADVAACGAMRAGMRCDARESRG